MLSKMFSVLTIGLFSVLTIGLFVITGLAQDGHFTYSTDYGFTYKAAVTNNHTFTNDNAYPYLISAMQFNSTVANTSVVTRVRPSKTYQFVGDVVSTNAQGSVETNYSAQVTNTIIVYVTNTLLSVTNAGSTIYDASDIPQMYLLLGDVITWTFSDNTSKLLYFDAIR